MATRWWDDIDIVLESGRLKWSWRLTSFDGLPFNKKIYRLTGTDPKTGKVFRCEQPVTHALLLTDNAQKAVTKAVELLADRAEHLEREAAKPLELKVAEELMRD